MNEDKRVDGVKYQTEVEAAEVAVPARPARKDSLESYSDKGVPLKDLTSAFEASTLVLVCNSKGFVAAHLSFLASVPSVFRCPLFSPRPLSFCRFLTMLPSVFGCLLRPLVRTVNVAQAYCCVHSLDYESYVSKL